jgi:predicted small lipoprotein YifL
MKRILYTLVLLGAAMALAACGRTYQAKPVSFRPPAAYPNAVTVMETTLGAKAFTDAQEARAAFGFDIRGSGLLPVQVVFHNEGRQALEINAAQSYLEDDGGNLWPLLARQVAYERVSGFSKTREVFSEGAKAGFFGAAAGALIGSAVGIVTGQNVLESAGKGAAVGAAAGGTLGGIKGYSSDDARRRISQDLREKSLENRQIGPNSLAHGFLFFPGEAPSARKLWLELVQVETGATRVITLPLDAAAQP